MIASLRTETSRVVCFAPDSHCSFPPLAGLRSTYAALRHYLCGLLVELGWIVELPRPRFHKRGHAIFAFAETEFGVTCWLITDQLEQSAFRDRLPIWRSAFPGRGLWCAKRSSSFDLALLGWEMRSAQCSMILPFKQGRCACAQAYGRDFYYKSSLNA